jgi:hypothetical protein
VIAEAEEEGLVLRLEDARQEHLNVVEMLVDEFVLTGGGVDEEAEGERDIGFAGEEAEFLWDAVFVEGEVILGEVGDQAALLVADGEGEGDEVGLDVEVGDLRGERQSEEKGSENQEWAQGWLLVDVRGCGAGGSRMDG